MRTTAEKSSTTTSPTVMQAARQPFIARAGRGDFFTPARSFVQAKMAVSKPGDKFEQEANRIAHKVMRMPAPAASSPGERLQQQDAEKVARADVADDKAQKAGDDKIQTATADEQKVQRREEEKILRAAAGEPVQKAVDDKVQHAIADDRKLPPLREEEKILKAVAPGEMLQKAEDTKLQQQPAGNDELQRAEAAGGAPVVDGGVESAIHDMTTGGEPLSLDVRNYIEPRFNADFSNVRIHRDGQAAALNNQMGARAFTYRNHIFFSRDQYQPGTSDGKELLAHELTHTIQQGHAVQRMVETPFATTGERASPSIQQAPASAAVAAATSSEVVNISSNVFSPSQRVRDEIEAQGAKGLNVRIIVKGLTGEGLVKVRADRAKNYDSVNKGSMPLLNPWAQQLGGMHLNFGVVNSEIVRGYASFKSGGGDTNDWLEALQKNSAVLGGLGLKVGRLPVPINKFDNGKLTLGVSNLHVEVGGFVDAMFNLSVENMSRPKVDATADIDIKGLAKGQLKLNNDAGTLVGQVSLAISHNAFSGEGNVTYKADGSVDVGGKAAYNSDKLSGEIQFVATDLESANSFTKNAIAAAGGKENVQEAAPPAPVPAPKEGQKKRALAATGQLAFNLTKWFAGTVNVIVDGKGAVTVIGKIAPPAEICLFQQRDWDYEIIKFEAKAYYGIPVVGNLNLFANISLHALAKLGPAKIYNIEILGTYSTDPDVQKNIQISGSINISAYGGLRLRAEGGAGVEIVEHDLKFGIGLNADVGIKAYADARPTIGYRDPGVFYISGTLELVAQPVLGLGGDFFIALETPWWSPLSDDRWTWPLFSKEWPLTDPIGISAAVKDYELGSGKVPEIELKKPEFDPSKFMTSMVDKTLPDKSGGAGAGQGTFKEDGTVPKPVVPPKKPPPKTVAAKPPKKGAPLKGGKSAAPDPKAAKDQPSGKILQNAAKPLAALKAKEALTRSELDKELAKIKAQVSGIEFGVQVKGDKWLVIPKAGGNTAKGVEVAAKQIGQKEAEPAESKAIKAKIRADLSGKIVTDARQADALISGEYQKYSKTGLKGIRVAVDPSRPSQLIVLANASLTEEVANLPVTVAGALKAVEFSHSFQFDNGKTVLRVYYDTDEKFFAQIKNDPKRPGPNHAEDIFAADHLGALLHQISVDRQKGELKTPAGQRVPVVLNLNRLPCSTCSPLIARLSQQHKDIQFVVQASSASTSELIQNMVPSDVAVYVDMIEKMLSAGVQVEPLHVYDAIWKKIEEVGRGVGTGFVTIHGDRLHDHVVALNLFIGANQAATKTVEELIARAKAKRDIGKIPPKGSVPLPGR